MTGGVTKSRPEGPPKHTSKRLSFLDDRHTSGSRSKPIEAILVSRFIPSPIAWVPVGKHDEEPCRTWTLELIPNKLWLDDESIPLRLVLESAKPVPSKLELDSNEVIEARRRTLYSAKSAFGIIPNKLGFDDESIPLRLVLDSAKPVPNKLEFDSKDVMEVRRRSLYSIQSEVALTEAVAPW